MLADTLELVDIHDHSTLFRRIHPDQVKPGGIVSTAAFKGHGDLSVDLCRLTTVARAIHRHPLHGLAVIAAGVPRACGLSVIHDPLPENIAHSLVCGKRTGSVVKRLRAESRLLVHPILPPSDS